MTELKLDTDKMIARKEGGIGWMYFNNPARRNAMSAAMREAIPVILADFQGDPEVRCVVMAGTGGKAFVSGADISEFKEKRSTPEQIAAYDEVGGQIEASFAALEKPLIAMIEGFCVGGGLMMAMRADLRFAAEGSQFGIPAVRLGLGYGFGGVNSLIKLIGPAAAAEILFSGARFEAADALRWGLVNRVVPLAELENTVKAFAGLIAENAPLTLRAIKASIGESLKSESRRDIARVSRLVDECFASEDYKEGRTAFMEKRRPQFKGR